MKSPAKPTLLDKMIALLVEQFGSEKVRASVLKATRNEKPVSDTTQTSIGSKKQGTLHQSIIDALDALKDSNPEKQQLLSNFYTRLKDRNVLTASQDIRHFTQLIGIKDIQGKSRKDLVSALMRSLLTFEIDKLKADIGRAADVSERQRQQGFSILTDKLITDK